MLQASLTLGGVILGAAIWLWILRRYDKIEPESIRHLVQVALFGGLLSVAAAALLNEGARQALGINVDLFADARLVGLGPLFLFCLLIGFSEEVCKAVAGVYTTRHLGDLNEPIDAMIYAMTVGLGFAAFENVIYAARFGNEVLLARFLWPVPAHMVYAALWGYGLAQARFLYPHRNRYAVMAPSVIVAAFMHAVANFLLFLQMTVTAVLSLLALAVLAGLAHYRLRRLVHESPFLLPGECASCRHVNDPAASSCAACGQPIGDTEMFVTCPNGCMRVPTHIEACPSCGTALGGHGKAIAVGMPQPDTA